MFVYLVSVAILNLALGYALAWFIHGLDPASDWSWHGFLNRARTTEPALAEATLGDPEIAAQPQLSESLAAGATTAEPPTMNQPAETPSAAERSLSPPAAAAPLVEQSFAEAAAELATTATGPASAAADLATAQAEALAAVEPLPDGDLHSIEQAVAELHAELEKYRADVSAIDEELRGCASAPNETAIQSCAARFREVNEQYLEHRDVRRALWEDGAEKSLASHLTQELAAAVVRQDELVAAAQVDLSQLELEVDLASRCTLLLSETQELSTSASRLNSTLDNALTEFARPAPAAAPVDPPARSQILVELQRLFGQHWPTDAASSAKVAVGLINPDELGRLNAQFGMAVVDRALDELQQVVTTTFTGPQQAAPLAQRGLLLLLPGLTAREALAVVERCRQRMDTTWFEHNGARFRVTISCAVTEAQQPEQAASVAERLEAMLHEAKRYGRNRTFIQDGAHPAPAVLPSLALEPRTLIV